MNVEIIEKKVQKRNYSLTLTVDPFNKRVRVDDYLGDVSSCVNEALQAVTEIAAEKLIFKVRQEHASTLIQFGFIYEATIDQFYLGSNCLFLVKYFTDERRNSKNWMKEDQILLDVLARPTDLTLQKLPNGYELRKAEESDASLLASLYGTVFAVYPTPMNNPAYIKKCMNNHTIFYIVTFKGEIVSTAAAEINDFYHNAEMTDCATLPEHRQFGLMKHLLVKLEEELLAKYIFCVYSIARALSFGMNLVLHQLHYQYNGRLANNCYIFDTLEDMNMWVKQLR